MERHVISAAKFLNHHPVMRDFAQAAETTVKFLLSQNGCQKQEYHFSYMNPAITLDPEKSNSQKWDYEEKTPRVQKENHLSVLIVDDVHESIVPLERVLRALGCSVFFVQNGYEAIEFLSHDSEIQLIFLDWNMPKMEGGETIEKTEKTISEDKNSEKIWEGRSLPVVTYTGEDIEKMYVPLTSHFSFIDHWPKSMAFQELYLQVQGIVNYLMKPSH
jgi:CheY-like chemotaxis protein